MDSPQLRTNPFLLKPHEVSDFPRLIRCGLRPAGLILEYRVSSRNKIRSYDSDDPHSRVNFVTKAKLLQEIADFYLQSRDFNGIPARTIPVSIVKLKVLV